MIRRLLTGMLLFGAAPGCADSLGPLDGDLYVLESIAGDPVPAPYVEDLGSDHRIVADSMSFAANGSGIRRTVYDEDAADGGSYTQQEEFTYTRAGNRIEIWFECADTAMCIAGPHLAGDIGDAAITFDVSVRTRKPLAFRRLFPPT
jgi:hypothetical protein